MSQTIFVNPIISSAPALTGTGNGTLTVDKLTHFTVAQTYTATCVAKTPDTLFSVAGSLDGAIGVAVAGTQFFDQDLKVFFTIQQGVTPFEIGDVFTFSVTNGTDLNQQNIDSYDEYPQKNFGAGLFGSSIGDHSLRYSNTAQKAFLYLQDLYFQAVATGSAGDAISIEYAEFIAGTQASLVNQDLTYTAVDDGVAGDNITMQYLNYDPAQDASITIQDTIFEAFPGAAGNLINVAFHNDGTAGFETVSVSGDIVIVHMQSGVSTAQQIVDAVNASVPAMLLFQLLDIRPGGTSSNPQIMTGPLFLSGGSDAVGAAGSEVVTVSGTDISVKMQAGVSTATQIRTALNASMDASELITTTISGTGSNIQTATPSSATPLSGGVDGIGFSSPHVTVTSTAILARFRSGVHTSAQLRTALLAVGAAAALVDVTDLGNAGNAQYAPISPTNLVGGRNKFYAFNHNEQSDSSNFTEGNASLKIKDLTASGLIKSSGPAEFRDVLALNDQTSAHASGSSVPNLQQYINDLIQDDKLTIRTADRSPLTWLKPQLYFTDDIVIAFPDTGRTNTIEIANSPIALTDGQHAYVVLDRTTNANLTPIVASTIPSRINAFRIASRYGNDLVMWDNTLIRDGRSLSFGEGGGPGSPHVTIYDPVSSSLPTGTSATLDSHVLVNGDLVLFTGLGSGNNQIYKVSGVGTSLSWSLQSLFINGAIPEAGDQVVIDKGTKFGLQQGIFDGATFKFNDVVRYFNGSDFWELSSIKSVSLVNHTQATLFTIASSGSENLIIDYSIVRGSAKETQSLYVTTDGTNAAVSRAGVALSPAGVEFDAYIISGVLSVDYIADNSGSGGTLKYIVRRWSNSLNGPTGLTSYSTAAPPSPGAGGSPGQVQYNVAGSLSGDSNFTWDATNHVLQLSSLEMLGLSSGIILTDNTAVLTTFLTFSASTYPSAIIEYSALRNGIRRTGRLLIANDGSSIALSNDFVRTADDGLTFDAALVTGNVALKFTSTSTGFDATFKYTMRRWS